VFSSYPYLPYLPHASIDWSLGAVSLDRALARTGIEIACSSSLGSGATEGGQASPPPSLPSPWRAVCMHAVRSAWAGMFGGLFSLIHVVLASRTIPSIRD